MKGFTPNTEQVMGMLNKRLPSRETSENLLRIAIFLGLDTEEGKLIAEQSELMLDLRQAVRGGRKNVKGSRHWPFDGQSMSDPTIESVG